MFLECKNNLVICFWTKGQYFYQEDQSHLSQVNAFSHFLSVLCTANSHQLYSTSSVNKLHWSMSVTAIIICVGLSMLLIQTWVSNKKTRNTSEQQYILCCTSAANDIML